MKDNVSIKFVYFDLGNVLVHFDPAIACQNIAELLSTDATTVNDAMYESGIEVQLESGKITETQFLSELFDRIGSTADEKEVLDAMGNMFWLNTQMLPVVCKLMETSVSMGILSNTCGPHWNWVTRQHFGLIRAIGNNCVLSYEVGAMKPDPKIYQIASERASCDPHEILFIDDRMENVQAAERLGWIAFQFTTALQFVKDLRSHGFDCFV